MAKEKVCLRRLRHKELSQPLPGQPNPASEQRKALGHLDTVRLQSACVTDDGNVASLKASASQRWLAPSGQSDGAKFVCFTDVWQSGSHDLG